jgi:hypothetical protein
MRLAFALLVGFACARASDPRLVYSKSFPGSKPAFVLITLEKDGRGEYKEATDDDQPVHFKMAPADTEEMFTLAAKLDNFKRPLESGLKVANMGMKTFRFEGEGDPVEAKFNYSQDTDAQALLDWFERVTESEGYLLELEKRARFDRLGVNQSLLQLEAAWDRKRLVALDQFLPLLDRVAKNDSYLNMARERAAKLAEAMRAEQKAKPEQ